VREQLDHIENSDEELAEMQGKVEAIRNECLKLADVLTAMRREAIVEVEKQMQQRLAPLGIPNVRFRVELSERELSHDGKDKVSFLFSANKSTELQPVSQVASGGEIARVMLSLKAMISGAVKLPTIIFDEIDTGVSGRVAEKMAQIMREMGDNRRQVISITHLPQIAAMGQFHYKVQKSETAEGTVSEMHELGADERIREIAQMLSGEDVTDAAISNAKELLSKANN
jgi:DNA repair protein RecN (Recombination protein N)